MSSDGYCPNCGEPLNDGDTHVCACTCYPWDGVHAVDCPLSKKVTDGKTQDSQATEAAPDAGAGKAAS